MSPVSAPARGGPTRSDEVVDRWLGSLLEQAAPDAAGLSLVALGSYGRGERAPFSDLDVLLLHDGHRSARDVASVADAVWYPIWDAGMRLDHSVRTVKESMSVAAADLRAAMGLLDARLVSGDGGLYRELVDRGRRLWEDRGHAWLPELARFVRERHIRAGEVAFLLEPDVKEGRGGLRDAQVMRAAAVARPALGPLSPDITEAAEVLRRVRSAMHDRAGRALEVLRLEDQDGVAAAAGFADADGLMSAVSAAGRTIAWRSDQMWQAVTARRSRPATLSPGVTLADGAVHVSGPDVEVVLRGAAFAAERGVPLSVSGSVSVATPWGLEARQALVALLGCGPAAIPVMETLDQTGVLVALIPEWASVRSRPQRNPYHRYTVDRHLLEAAAQAALVARRVRRPDLLLIGALLHDIGKGVPGEDHTDAGVRLMGVIGSRLGFPPSDVDVLVAMVRNHLTVPDAATRRDISDPATVSAVASALGSADVVDLLEALSEADGLATGPSAWGPWKASLIAELCQRVRRVLAGESIEFEPWVPLGSLSLGVTIGPTVRVVAADRTGLLADVAGALAASGLEVQSARTATVEDVAVQEFDVTPEMGDWPAQARVQARVESAAAGTLPLEGLLAERMRAYRRRRMPSTIAPEVLFESATAATVVEVRAADSLGLLSRVARALTAAGLDVVQVRAVTLGQQAVDAFYVRGSFDSEHIRAVVLEAATPA